MKKKMVLWLTSASLLLVLAVPVVAASSETNQTQARFQILIHGVGG